MKKIFVLLTLVSWLCSCGAVSEAPPAGSSSGNAAIGAVNPLPPANDDDFLGHLLAEETDPVAREFLQRGNQPGRSQYKTSLHR